MSCCSGWRGWAFVLALLPLGGCGFHPLYGERATLGYDPALAAITVMPIADRIGQIVETALREDFNPREVAVKPRYTLLVIVNVARSDLAIQRNATSLRSRLNAAAHFRLSDTANSHVIFTGTSSAITSFNVPFDAYAATVAEQNAREVAAQDLSRDIATQITIFMHQRNAG